MSLLLNFNQFQWLKTDAFFIISVLQAHHPFGVTQLTLFYQVERKLA